MSLQEIICSRLKKDTEIEMHKLSVLSQGTSLFNRFAIKMIPMLRDDDLQLGKELLLLPYAIKIK